VSESPGAQAWSPGQPLAGWLRLSGRGAWLIRDAAVEHPSLRAHLNRHYGRDAQGRYFVQNGAQIVYVQLDYAPYTLHVAATERWSPTPKNRPARHWRRVWTRPACSRC